MNPIYIAPTAAEIRKYNPQSFNITNVFGPSSHHQAIQNVQKLENNSRTDKLVHRTPAAQTTEWSAEATLKNITLGHT